MCQLIRCDVMVEREKNDDYGEDVYTFYSIHFCRSAAGQAPPFHSSLIIIIGALVFSCGTSR